MLFTGKGGVGKTTTSAATAALAAQRGHKTLVLSTDPAHSLADAFGQPLGDEPTEIDTGLYGQQIDTQRAFEASWREVQHYLREVLEQGGVDPIEAEELTVLPGAEEVLALLELRAQVSCGRWDVVIVDCAPTAETLRLLALPEALGWYMERLFPTQRRVVRSLRPVLSQLAGMAMPPDRVFAAVERLHGELADVRQLLVDPVSTSVRLVLTPESVVVAEARRTLTSLAMHGYRVDGVVANRIFPASGDEWMQRWAAAQEEQLAEITASFGALPVWRSAYRSAEPVGLHELTGLAEEMYADADPLAVTETPEPMTVERVATDEFVLSVALPHADKREVDLVRKGDELVLTVGSQRRLIALPSVLKRCVADGAGLRDGRLRVRFRPDPDVWMRT
ncbi:MAG: arsenite/tail-anchored protein-transporting ATPase [Frankiaceae bacterium]|nr:arsenite/tail-anchored protein-transporting ATPase [Frankiaceae bacterium]